MINEIEMLNYIYQNSKMGIINIDNFKNMIKNKGLLKVLKSQEDNYFEICTEATDFLTIMNKEREEISNITKVMTYIDNRINTMNDNSTKNIAKIIITTNNKGIIEIEEKINNYTGKSKRVLSLARKLLRLEKSNIEKLKKYL